MWPTLALSSPQLFTRLLKEEKLIQMFFLSLWNAPKTLWVGKIFEAFQGQGSSPVFASNN